LGSGQGLWPISLILFITQRANKHKDKRPALRGSALKNSTSAPGDAIWGVQIDVITSMANLEVFFAPQVPPAPRCTPVVISTKLTSRLSCSVLRGPALLRPHPRSKRRPGGPYSRRGLHLQEAKPSKNNGSERPSAFELAQKAFEARGMRSHEEGCAAS
jgi:hypothetical protein